MPLNIRNEKRKVENRIVGWGKYAGRVIRNVPTEYLKWFVNNAYGQMVNRKRWAKEELDRRSKLNL